MGRIIGYVLRDVRTLEYRADGNMSPDIRDALRFPTSDDAHNFKQAYQQVVELVEVDPPRRIVSIGDILSYVGLALIALGIWRLL